MRLILFLNSVYRFSEVFRGYKKIPVALNGLNTHRILDENNSVFIVSTDQISFFKLIIDFFL